MSDEYIMALCINAYEEAYYIFMYFYLMFSNSQKQISPFIFCEQHTYSFFMPVANKSFALETVHREGERHMGCQPRNFVYYKCVMCYIWYCFADRFQPSNISIS